MCPCACVPRARVHVCNNLGFSVWYYVPHTYVPGVSSLSAGYQDTYTYVHTYVPGWGTYYVPHMYVNWCEHVCLYLVSTKSSTEKQSSSAIIVHEAKRTASSTIYTRHNKPYRLGAAPTGVVGTPSRCCRAATVPAAVVFACGFRCCFAD